MSRTGLHRPRRNRAVWDRTATGTRLLQSSSSYTVSPGIPLPGDGRSIDSTRHTLLYGHSRDCAHTLWRTTPAHSTGEADRPYYTGLSPGAIAPPAHSPVAYLGVLPSPSDGREDALPPPLRLAERMWDLSPFLDSPVVAFGEAMPHSDGRESTPPYLRMGRHFWWSRLPYTEIPSRLFHVLSEARGCRRAGVDVDHPLWRTTRIDTAVAVFLRKSPGPSILSLPSHFLCHSCGGRSQMRQGVNPSPEGQGPRSSGRTLPFSSRDDRPVAQGVGAPSGASTPLPTHESNRNLPCPSLPHRRLPHPRKMAKHFPGEQSYRHELSIESIKSPHRDNPLTQ